jgi:hypothetical protein
MRLLLARGQPGEQPPHLNGGRRLAASVAMALAAPSVRCEVQVRLA